MLLHFYESTGWQPWGVGERPVIPEGMPVLIDEDFQFEDAAGPRPSRAVNAWLRSLPSSGAPAANTWRVYAQALRDWLVHLGLHGLSPFSCRVDLVAALGTYADRRLCGPVSERLAGSSWGVQMTAVAAFYEWAEAEGYAEAAPFTTAVVQRVTDERVRAVRRNYAKLRRAKPHVGIKYVQADFAELFCRSLAGLAPDGMENPAFRGWYPGRNSAVARLVLSTGLRRREFTHLLVHEVPPLPSEPTEVPILFPVPELAAKGRRPRLTWIDYDALVAVHTYMRLERAVSAASASWRPEDPLVVTEPDLFGARVNGRRTAWSALTPAERRRLVEPGGGSSLLAISRGGRPFLDWATVFRRASRRIRASVEPRFPDVHPHRLRHSFAMATLERLVTGHYQRAAELVAAAGGDAALAFYLTKADPLEILRDLLGHSSVTTTEIYLKRLDVHRIYRAAYERAGQRAGQVDPAVDAEVDAEFADEFGESGEEV
ncbi:MULTISPECIES: site-specific integrase [Prauserella salsuginis group]|uniref:Core-binding (CB) domain-containing protein n=1 Tax=Prauserella salsuginis TaxID=387889 RepID=A0ABW6G268_9PSEU|nr:MULTISPECIES: site-specific integrase [Prauserella salsuginis group]MCR3736539.1 Site-specific recombinase XerD [Prauserella salsuginis]